MEIPLRHTRTASKPASWFIGRASLFLLPLIAAALSTIELGQDINWDIKNYHFYGGFAFLHKPLNYDFAPAQVQSFFNPVLHVFSYLMLAHLPARLTAMILGFIQGLNFILLFEIGRVSFSRWPRSLRFWTSLSCASAGCYGSAFISELGTTFGDNLTSILILTALLLLIRWLLPESSQTALRSSAPAVAGAILGAAMGLKLTVAIYGVGIGVALCAVVLLAERRMKPLLIFGLWFFIGFAAVYGYWGWNLWREYQNPFFPYMNAVFQSPFYEKVNISDARFFPRTLQQAFFYPFFFAQKNNLASEVYFRDIRIALCYLAFIALAAGAVIGRFRRVRRSGGIQNLNRESRVLWFFAVFFVVSYVLWQVQFSIYRYLIVLELLAPLFIAQIMDRFFSKRKLVFFFSLGINAGIALCVVPGNFGRQPFDSAFLKTSVPSIEEIEESLVLMGGADPTSYIIPSMPAGTRFVRVSSNFLFPGKNVNLDRKIRTLLAEYDSEHTFVYFSGTAEKESVSRDAAYYGVFVDAENCWNVSSVGAPGGTLCETMKSSGSKLQSLPMAGVVEPVFQAKKGVRLIVAPAELEDGDKVEFCLGGLKLQSIDLFYTLNDTRMPPLNNLNLDGRGCISFPVSAATRTGLYHFAGVRDARADDNEAWIMVDASAVVR